jgi:hypothetical protein
MIDERAVKTLVDDFSQWRGNSYTLAMLVFKQTQESVAVRVREDLALKLEGAGMVDAAAVVRAD